MGLIQSKSNCLSNVSKYSRSINKKLSCENLQKKKNKILGVRIATKKNHFNVHICIPSAYILMDIVTESNSKFKHIRWSFSISISNYYCAYPQLCVWENNSYNAISKRTKKNYFLFKVNKTQIPINLRQMCAIICVTFFNWLVESLAMCSSVQSFQIE